MIEIEKLNHLSAYQVEEVRDVKELNSRGAVLRHRKTGARVFLLSNDDKNKVFSIGFRTPPKDSTGVPHILEHSVLCGSEKFPVKDPFVELVKGSLNTFLNAMTYPDKTVYPVASCNEKDFQNLMDVYMDAVFHPNIYKEKKIFLQEGWHYEMEDENAPLTINGVVYNEMKGVYSSPESVLDRYIQKLLYPDNCYCQESGGDPDVIPELTYEDFLDFHRTYYHPSNSFIYLYGDMDMEEKLTWLDAEYLSRYGNEPVDSEIPLQKPFERPVEEEIFYSITEEEPEEKATYLSVNTVVGTDLDPKLYLAFQILEYALINVPGAPVKQALLDAGIGEDILGGYENGILQPYFSVVAKGAEREQKGEFVAVLKGTLRKLADQGLDKKSLRSGINYFEFRSREADYGTAPKGLMYGLQSMDSWLYGGDPMMHLAYGETFEFLKKAVDEGYFENLIRDYLLDNPAEAVIIVSPKKNLTAMKDAALAEKLAAMKASMTPEEIRSLVEETKALKAYQDEPSPKEDLEKIPLLKREDIEPQAEKLIWEETETDGIKVIRHQMFTSGIGYLKLLFGTDQVPTEDLPYVGLLKSVLGYVNTEHYSYSELSSEIYLNSGGVNFGVTAYPNLEEPENFTGVFTADVKVLCEKLDFGFEILREILTTSVLDDEKRLGEILGETRSRAKMKIESAGHSAAVSRATSYFSPTGAFGEMTGGIGYYHFLEKTAREFPERKGEIIAKLKEVCGKLFTRDNLLVSFTAGEDGFAALDGEVRRFAAALPAGGERHPFQWVRGNRNEGFKSSSQVNYVARCGNFREKGFAYTGALRILKVMLSYDYLWINLRVKGGAYGCMSGFGRSGEGYLVSYRDPNLRETNSVYEGVTEYLRNFQADERDMTKFVIGTISDLDTPLTPSIRGSRGLSAYLSGVTQEMMQEERDQVLRATVEDIRALADIVQAVLDTGALCVLGNEEKIEAAKDLFKETRNLYQA